MKFTRELPVTLTVRSVAADGIRINDELWTESLALTPSEIVDGWKPIAVSDLLIADFEPVMKESPELVILGTGTEGLFPPRELTFAFARQGIGFEVMDTAAAARTFNVLAGEGRRIAAVLFPI